MQKIINNSGVLIATGGIGGDANAGFNFIDKALQCDAIDVMSIHRYFHSLVILSQKHNHANCLPINVHQLRLHSRLLDVQPPNLLIERQEPLEAPNGRRIRLLRQRKPPMWFRVSG